MNSRLACFCWRLLHKKTPTKHWAKHRGWSMASRCSSFSNDKTELLLFFSCNLAQQLWTWLLNHGSPTPYFPLSASTIWTAIAQGVDVPGRRICRSNLLPHHLYPLVSSDRFQAPQSEALSCQSKVYIFGSYERTGKLPITFETFSSPHSHVIGADYIIFP